MSSFTFDVDDKKIILKIDDRIKFLNIKEE